MITGRFLVVAGGLAIAATASVHVRAVGPLQPFSSAPVATAADVSRSARPPRLLLRHLPQ